MRNGLICCKLNRNFKAIQLGAKQFFVILDQGMDKRMGNVVIKPAEAQAVTSG